MESIIVLLLLYVLIYCGFIAAISIGYGKIKSFAIANAEIQTTFSIVIPFRNEEANLHLLLASLSQIKYPIDKFELIFVDDFSEDFSSNVINKWRMQHGKFQTTLLENLRLSASPKKDAITRAVPIIKNNWILTTDADCIVSPEWLATLNAFIASTDVKMIAGPVAYSGNNSFLHHFQRLDMLSLQAATVGSFGIRKPFMCNGANLAYTKQLFLDLSGFASNDTIASGDDVFLLQNAVARFPDQVRYLKSKHTIVKTKPVSSWRALFNQRIRWASKTANYEDAFGQDLALVVFFGNLAIVLSLLFCAIGILNWKIPIMLYALKMIPDTIVLIQANRFFRNGRFFFPFFSAVLYPLFSVAVALFAIVGRYEWKGRKY